MKKILLTLFSVAAVFVACDKDELGYESSSINVLEEAKEIGATVENSSDFDAAFDFIQNLNNSNKILVPSESPSTARGGDYGNNWLQVVFFDRSATDASDLAYLRSDAQGEVCAGASLVNPEEYFYHLPAPDQLIIESGTGSQTFTVPSGSYDSTFQQDGPEALIVMNSARTSAAAGIAPAVADYDFSCGPAPITWAPSAPVNGITTYTSSTGLVYTIQAAPFPLTGFLATTTEAGSVNYAGTTLQEVRDAIEGDLTD